MCVVKTTDPHERSTADAELRVIEAYALVGHPSRESTRVDAVRLSIAHNSP